MMMKYQLLDIVIIFFQEMNYKIGLDLILVVHYVDMIFEHILVDKNNLKKNDSTKKNL